MGRNQHIHTFRHLASAVMMLLALAWLTVCLPYVNKAQQNYVQFCKQAGKAVVDDNNPLCNTTEEKNESGTSLLQEYLHEMPEVTQNFITLAAYYKCHPSDLYHAYHPELVIPPPEV